MKLEELCASGERRSFVIDVTPEMATQWLEHNSNNRPVVDAHVDYLAGEMKAGRWKLTHQGIAFSPKRVLLDGQHRLWAIMMSGATLPMRVFVNEPSEGLEVIDTGKTRSNDQILSMSGGIGKVTREELAALRAMLAGLGSYRRKSAGDELAHLVRHREAVAFAVKCMSGKRRFRGMATNITKAVIARAWYSCDHARLQHFADVLLTGTPRSEHDQPIMLLFQYLMGCKALAGHLGRPESRERYSKTERALLAFLRGDRPAKLYAAPHELFPLPEEMMPSAVKNPGAAA